jgi:hypothetical protein
MSADEKTRSSGESPREQTSGPILPTVNPDAEKAQTAKSSGIHPAFYVVYVAVVGLK